MSESPPNPYPLARGQVGELFFLTHDAIAILDPGWRIVRWNAAAERLLGYPEDGLLGKDFASLFPSPDEFEQARRDLTETRDSVSGRTGEARGVRIRSRTGRLIRVRCRLIAFRDPGDKSGWEAVQIEEEPEENLDATGLARVRQLNRLAETAAAIVGETDQARVAQSLTDLTKELLDADFTALALMEAKPGGGYTITRFTYNAPQHLIPNPLPRVEGLLAVALESRSVLRVPSIHAMATNTPIPEQYASIGALLAAPLLVGDRVLGELLAAKRVGRPAFSAIDETLAAHLGTIATARLENVRLHGELAKKASELEALNRRRREVVAAIAHDLRTPAGTLLGYVDLAADPRLPERNRDLVFDRLKDQAIQLRRMVDDLSTASQLDAARVSVVLTTVDLTSILDELSADYRVRMPNRRLEVSGLPAPPVQADRERLTQVLTNLIDNAIKFSPASSLVQISVTSTDQRVALKVCDKGPGISANDLPHIFEPFYRSDATASAPGIGLGLTIVKGLMEAMKGGVQVESSPGMGSCFTLDWLRARESDQA